MEMDTLITLGTGIAAIAVIVTVIRGLRDDMRANNNELRDELRSDKPNCARTYANCAGF